MSTPDLHLQTSFLLDGAGRIIGTREPEPSPGPLFSLIKGRVSCTWAVRADVPQDTADELDGLARLGGALQLCQDDICSDKLHLHRLPRVTIQLSQIQATYTGIGTHAG